MATLTRREAWAVLNRIARQGGYAEEDAPEPNLGTHGRGTWRRDLPVQTDHGERSIEVNVCASGWDHSSTVGEPEGHATHVTLTVRLASYRRRTRTYKVRQDSTLNEEGLANALDALADEARDDARREAEAKARAEAQRSAYEAARDTIEGLHPGTFASADGSRLALGRGTVECVGLRMREGQTVPLDAEVRVNGDGTVNVELRRLAVEDALLVLGVLTGEGE